MGELKPCAFRLQLELNASNTYIDDLESKISKLENAIHEVDQVCVSWGLIFDIDKPKKSIKNLLFIETIAATDPEISKSAKLNNLLQQAKGLKDFAESLMFRGCHENTFNKYDIDEYAIKLRKQADELEKADELDRSILDEIS